MSPKIVQFCVDNCIRQKTWLDEPLYAHGLQAVSDMYAAYMNFHYAMQSIYNQPEPFNQVPMHNCFGEQDIKLLGATVFPSGNIHGYRTTNVTVSGNLCMDPSLVPQAMSSLVAHFPRTDADGFTKEFLTIHPFVNGNGRVGAILWNFLKGTMSNPQPMPYFFGEQL